MIHMITQWMRSKYVIGYAIVCGDTQQQWCQSTSNTNLRSSSYVQPFSNFMNGLRILLQQYDDEHKPEQNSNPRGCSTDNTDCQANTMQQSPEEFERFKNEMKELGMWLEGDTCKKITPAQQKAHKDKVKAIWQQKRATQTNTGQIAPTTPSTDIEQTPAPLATPQTFAQMAAQLTNNVPSFTPEVIISNSCQYQLATARRTYHANACIQPKGSLVSIRQLSS
jgi:hypothetical protein